MGTDPHEPGASFPINRISEVEYEDQKMFWIYGAWIHGVLMVGWCNILILKTGVKYGSSWRSQNVMGKWEMSDAILGQFSG
jgi:hypothetical protein